MRNNRSTGNLLQVGGFLTGFQSITGIQKTSNVWKMCKIMSQKKTKLLAYTSYFDVTLSVYYIILDSFQSLFNFVRWESMQVVNKIKKKRIKNKKVNPNFWLLLHVWGGPYRHSKNTCTSGAAAAQSIKESAPSGWVGRHAESVSGACSCMFK